MRNITGMRESRKTGRTGFPSELTTSVTLPFVYLAVITVVVVGSISWQLFGEVLASGLASHRRGSGLNFAFFLTWILIAVGGLSLWLRACGPIGFSSAILTWCLGSSKFSTRVHRRMLLRQMLAATGASVFAGTAALLIIFPVSGRAVHFAIILAAVLLGPALTSITLAEQSRAATPRPLAVRTFGTAAMVAGLIIWYVTAFNLTAVGSETAVWYAGTVVAVILGAGLSSLRWFHIVTESGSISIGELRRAGDFTERVAASIAMLNSLPLESAPRPRRPIRFRNWQFPAWGRVGWLAWANARQVLIRWRALAVIVLMIPLTGSVSRVAGHDWGCLTLIIVDFAVASQLARWLATWSRSPSLRFLVPFPDALTWLALLTTPAAGVFVFSAGAIGLARLSPWWIGTSLLLTVLGLARRVQARDAGGDFALWLWTPAGPLPINLALRLAAGWDAAALGALGAFALTDAGAFRAVLVLTLLYLVRAAAVTSRNSR